MVKRSMKFHLCYVKLCYIFLYLGCHVILFTVTSECTGYVASTTRPIMAWRLVLEREESNLRAVDIICKKQVKHTQEFSIID